MDKTLKAYILISLGPILGLTLGFKSTWLYGASAGEDASIYVTALKEEEIDEKILSSDVFADCKKSLEGIDLSSDTGKEEIRKCIQDKVSKVDDESVGEFSKALNLGSVGFKETKNTKSLREYLNKRIFNAIHGKDAYENKQIKELKFVDPGLFLELYKTQISKNLILEVSQYCLENVGVKGEEGAFITGVSSSMDDLISGESSSLQLNYQQVADTSANPWGKLDVNAVGKTLKIDGLNSAGALWDKIQEYRYCPVLKDSPSDPCHKSKARNQEQLKILKEQELAWAQADETKIRTKYTTCSNFMIKNMCELYRCNNIYTASSSSILYKEPASKVCKAFGVSLAPGQNDGALSGGVSLENRSKDNRGQIACNLMERVERYKKTFAAIDQAEKNNNDLRGLGSGVELGTFYKEGKYNKKNIDDLSTISSKELVESVDSFAKSEEEIKELKEKCFQEDGLLAQGEDCAFLGGELDGEDLTKVQLDTEAETALYLERLKKLEDGSDNDELKEYLLKHGLHDYVPMLEDGSIEPGDLVKLISDKYKADRQALINNMNERFYAITKKKKSEGDDATATRGDLSAVAKDQVAEIEQHKERLETLFNYSNIVSSYLEAKDQEDKVYKNTRVRQVELEGLKADEKAKADYELYFSDAKEETAANSQLSAQGQFIDGILGIGSEDTGSEN